MVCIHLWYFKHFSMERGNICSKIHIFSPNHWKIRVALHWEKFMLHRDKNSENFWFLLSPPVPGEKSGFLISDRHLFLYMVLSEKTLFFKYIWYTYIRGISKNSVWGAALFCSKIHTFSSNHWKNKGCAPLGKKYATP